ncbi:hypothetical protein [Methylocystis sp.]|uniref:hypothetical protein n=1 Tax=Methylocystis sp. TaxID=1911079 RepID=UPI003DA1D2F1
MTKDTAAQLALLADALTEIVDLTPARATSGASSDELLNRAVDIAAGALAAAATYGRLPPFMDNAAFVGEAQN